MDNNGKGYTFAELKEIVRINYAAMTSAVVNLRITYGTRDQKFHVITPSDRDYKVFDCSVAEFEHTETEEKAIAMINRPRITTGGTIHRNTP